MRSAARFAAASIADWSLGGAGNCAESDTAAATRTAAVSVEAQAIKERLAIDVAWNRDAEVLEHRRCDVHDRGSSLTRDPPARDEHAGGGRGGVGAGSGT